MFGLPAGVRACLFDMDGVLTKTSDIHEAAWKRTFDAFLASEAAAAAEDRSPFTTTDYGRYVDGKPRADGVRDFLASRGITIPEGTAADGPEAATVSGIGAAKNQLVQQLIRDDGVEVFAGSITYVRQVRAAGLATAIVSSSANAERILDAAGIADLFDVRVDGLVAKQQHLTGKPAPDTFTYAAARLGVEPSQAAVFEDALSGVAAGKAGGFALVVGVDRLNQGAQLRQHGADVVVTDVAQLLESA